MTDRVAGVAYEAGLRDECLIADQCLKVVLAPVTVRPFHRSAEVCDVSVCFAVGPSGQWDLQRRDIDANELTCLHEIHGIGDSRRDWSQRRPVIRG